MSHLRKLDGPAGLGVAGGAGAGCGRRDELHAVDGQLCDRVVLQAEKLPRSQLIGDGGVGRCVELPGESGAEVAAQICGQRRQAVPRSPRRPVIRTVTPESHTIRITPPILRSTSFLPFVSPVSGFQ